MTKSLPFIVGAGGSMPADPVQQNEYYELMARQDWIDGLEIPFTKDGLTSQVSQLVRQLAPRWRFNTITGLPTVKQHLEVDPDYGLASEEHESRKAAVAECLRMRDDIRALNDEAGELIISRLMIHTAPSRRARLDALFRSLDDLAEVDFDGAALVIEHCDSYVSKFPSQKGFLPLSDEVAAASSRGIGIVINWGRSAHEEHDPEAPLHHIEAVLETGTLDGLVFSGISDRETYYAGPWEDGHLPLQEDDQASLMTAEHVAKAAELARGEMRNAPLAFMGVKVAAPREASLPQRLEMLQRVAKAAGMLE